MIELISGLTVLAVLVPVLTWLSLLVVTCMLLESKNRSGLLGFIAYLFFPVAALIYAACVPSKLKVAMPLPFVEQPPLDRPLTGKEMLARYQEKERT